VADLRYPLVIKPVDGVGCEGVVPVANPAHLPEALACLQTVTGRDDFLARLDGVVFGDSVKHGVRYGNKFYHKDLGFALEFPAGWRIENRPKELLAISRDNKAVLRVTLEDINRRVSPRDFMVKRLKLKELAQESPLDLKGLKGHTAIAPVTWSFGRRDTRVSVIFFGDKAYVFYGTGKTDAAFAAADPLILSSVRSFHALSAAEQKLAEGLRVEVITASAGDTFARLAADSPIPNYPARILRIINDKYPEGEPVPGQKLKIIR
jgi:predicted Zn-dependent protease